MHKVITTAAAISAVTASTMAVASPAVPHHPTADIAAHVTMAPEQRASASDILASDDILVQKALNTPLHNLLASENNPSGRSAKPNLNLFLVTGFIFNDPAAKPASPKLVAALESDIELSTKIDAGTATVRDLVQRTRDLGHDHSVATVVLDSRGRAGLLS